MGVEIFFLLLLLCRCFHNSLVQTTAREVDIVKEYWKNNSGAIFSFVKGVKNDNGKV